MFSIRRIFDDVVPVNRSAISQVDALFRANFAGADPTTIEGLGEALRNPFGTRFRTVLFVAEGSHRRNVNGFALVSHEPQLRFTLLDYIVGKIARRGVGAALYERVRAEAAKVHSEGLLFECLPDDPERCADSTLHADNVARLRFYERYGARPILGTAYETPVPGGSDDCLPHLVFDGLDRRQRPSAAWLRKVIRAILERKYAAICPPEYVDRIVRSVADPVQLRPHRYQGSVPAPSKPRIAPLERVALTVNDKHDIHHIRERGYVESPVRIKAIVGAVEASELFDPIPVRAQRLSHITAVHDPELVKYLRRACKGAPEGVSIYPYVFPIRNATRPPRELSVRAGYYCIDTFTPIHRNAFLAARRAVECALTCADQLLAGRRAAYALVRPPGHHAERASFGGFCYLNNAAIAAHRLSAYGRVAMLDVDYHHGNGQQNIFYERSDVLTVSIHGDPDFAYPYFTGFADERGSGDGEGYNVNLPMPEHVDGARYRKALIGALDRVRAFKPSFLVVCLGLDPAKGDPTGTWSLGARDFEENGRLIGMLSLPTLVVQEGGYRTRSLGTNALSFFTGLVGASHAH